MTKIIFKDGFWGLGKSTDVKKTTGWKFHENAGRSMGELRFSLPYAFLTAASSIISNGNSSDQVFLNDRSPYSFWMLNKLGWISFDKPINGTEWLRLTDGDPFEAQKELTKVHEMCLIDFEIMITKFSGNTTNATDLKFEFHHYRPVDIEAHSDWIINQVKDPSWVIKKMLNPSHMDLDDKELLIQSINDGINMIRERVLSLASRTKNFEYMEFFKRTYGNSST